VLALVLPVLACGLTASLIFFNIPKLPGALEAFDVKKLTRVIVPGSAEINFPESGAYAIYYEYHSDFNGVSYVRAQNLPRINCRLTSKASGEEIKLEPTLVEGDIYSPQNKVRAGVLMNNISINQPGTYAFSCRYLDGRSNPHLVLAIGPNMIWEFFNLAEKPAAAIAGGLIVFFFVSVVSLIIVVFVAIKRNQSKNRMAA
jgi:hypothetical protein